MFIISTTCPRAVSNAYGRYGVYSVTYMARREDVDGLYHKIQVPNAIGSMSGHAEGSKAFARYREVDEELQREMVSAID